MNQFAIALTLVLMVTGYLIGCRIWPFQRCRPCKGTGWRNAHILGGFRLCPRCNATGRRVRLGRYLTSGARDLKAARDQS